jgi:hypothetical protein
MALTVDANFDWYGSKWRIVEVTGDSSYASGGESLTPADCGFNEIRAMFCTSQSGYVFTYDGANEKLMCYHGDYSESTDGVLVEATGANLSAVTVFCLVFGV